VYPQSICIFMYMCICVYMHICVCVYVVRVKVRDKACECLCMYVCGCRRVL